MKFSFFSHYPIFYMKFSFFSHHPIFYMKLYALYERPVIFKETNILWSVANLQTNRLGPKSLQPVYLTLNYNLSSQLICSVVYGFGSLEVTCWPLVPKFAGSKPAEAVGFLRAKKSSVKPSVPCGRFAACKSSLELRGSRILDEIFRNISCPRRVPPFAARGLSRRWTWRHLAEKVGTPKGGGKQWQPTPKNLPRMQRARAIPVAWQCSGSC
jgi:hypothetical protein